MEQNQQSPQQIDRANLEAQQGANSNQMIDNPAEKALAEQKLLEEEYMDEV